MTTNKSRIFARISVVVLAFAFLAPLAASAAQITSGTLTLSDSRPDETGVSYTFSGSSFGVGTIGCIELEFNTAADGSGTAVTGLDASGALLGSSTLVTAGNWTDESTTGALVITNATPVAPASSGNIVWTGVTNGGPDGTYFGIFNTYTTDTCTTVVDSTVVAFTYTDGVLVEMSVDPALTFDVLGVADSLLVNGATTTVESFANGINYGNDVTAIANGISAHDLQVTTNADGGYTVSLRQTGGFSLPGDAYTIPALSGSSNASPIAFSLAGTEGWGYTTDDSSLAGGTSDRFTNPSDDVWAGMPTTNELVMDGVAGATQTTRVGHQVGIANTTPAGAYSTTLVYTAAATY